MRKIDQNMSNRDLIVQLYQLCLDMGHIIRHLDTENEWLEYWTNDGEYIVSLGESDWIYER